MKRIALLILAASLVGCSSTGDGASLNEKARASVAHGEKQLTEYALLMLAAMTDRVVTELEAFHTTHVAKLITDGKAAEAVTAEKQYQAQLIQIQLDLEAEYQKIARMGLDFRNAERFEEVVQKSIENAGEVDINAVITLASEVATASGLDLGPVTTVLNNLKKARGLPETTSAPLAAPVIAK